MLNFYKENVYEPNPSLRQPQAPSTSHALHHRTQVMRGYPHPEWDQVMRGYAHPDLEAKDQLGDFDEDR